MRVVMLTTEYPPHWGGLGANVFYTARELARTGHDVHVVTRRGGGEPPALPGVTVHREGMAPVPAYYAVSFARRAVRRALALDPDVVHVASPCVLPTRRDWDALDAAGVVTAATFHGSWRGERNALEPRRGLTVNDAGIIALTRFLEPLERLALRRARLPITVSEFAKRELALYDAAAAERLVIVPNGVDTTEFTPGAPAGDGRVVAVGRLSGRKNLDTLVRAAGRLRGLSKLTIIGRDGGLGRAIRAEAAKRDVPLDVLESASHERLLAELRAADVFALPSRYEAQGIAFLEAMACGLPSVGGDAGGVPEVVEDGETGALVAPDDEEGLARAVQLYLDDPALARRHGTAGRARAETRFEWARIAEDLAGRFKEALA